MGIKEKLIRAMSLNVVLWMAMLTVFAGLMFCAAGAYMAMAAAFQPVQAALITGGGLIAIVAVALIAVMYANRPEKPSETKPVQHGSDNPLEHQLRPLIGDQATEWAKRNSGLAVVGALSAGVILSASPRLRSLLLGAAGPIVTRKLMKTVDHLTGDD